MFNSSFLSPSSDGDSRRYSATSSIVSATTVEAMARSSGEVIQKVEASLSAMDGAQEFTETEADLRRLEIVKEMREHLVYRRSAMLRSVGQRTGSILGNKVHRSGLMRQLWRQLQHGLDRGGILLWANDIKNIEGKFGSGVGTYFRFLRFLLTFNIVTFVITFGFVVVPQVVYRYRYNQGYSGNFTFADLITGTGWMAQTEMLYGYYTSDNITYSNGEKVYEMDKAYFFTTFCCYLIALLYISITMARSYRKNFIEAQATVINEYCNTVFAGWDFAILGKYTSFEHASLRTQLTLLQNQSLVEEEALTAKKQKAYLKDILTLFMWLLSIGILVGIGFLVYFILGLISDTEDMYFVPQMATSATVTAFMLVVPWIFSVMNLLYGRDSNGQNVRSKMYQTLAKTVLLEVTVLTVVVYRYEHELSSAYDECWENGMGQEMYRFLIVFLVGIVFLTFLLETFYRHIIQPRTKWQNAVTLDPPEFDIARNTMHLIYAQTVTWIGLYFSPLTSLVFILALIITFYTKKMSLKFNCNISTTPWRAAQSQTVFLVFTFFSLIGAAINYAYVITIPSSKHCGPFINHNKPYGVWSNDDDNFFSLFIFQPGFAVCVNVALLVMLYYTRSHHVARRRQVNALRKRRDHLRDENVLLKHGIDRVRAMQTLPPLSRRNSRLVQQQHH